MKPCSTLSLREWQRRLKRFNSSLAHEVAILVPSGEGTPPWFIRCFGQYPQDVASILCRSPTETGF